MSDNLVQSVERSMILLEKLAEEKNGIGITRLSEMVGLHKSTVHRLLGTLMSRGYVEKKLDSDKYKLGKKILFLASSILDSMDLRKIASPYLRKLANNTQEVVHLSILDGDEAVYVDKVEGDYMNSSVRMNSQIGKRVPLYCTAVGKILVSHLDNAHIKAMVKEEDMIKLTEKTITNIDDFIKEIDFVREKGYALDDVENEEGIRCVAVPIYDKDGKITASASVSGLTIILNGEKLESVKEELIKTSKLISYQLGYLE
ncbi:IclR family transcriptional regulator [Clostridium grantii]|uniref:Glycerol operon regulatory protein n=1 Tax=Clostridium grantii DSM 8605 TaxID=1121316 RepID=A0A1M5WBV9_9CLOT|nr:IclR family transcriptional regulator [Clostridium grantii]SHH84940.1 transcriptional regulator, IclR family [Clostridium grantii DSM 8605]